MLVQAGIHPLIQENNIKYLDTKFANYKSSMHEFRNEHEIHAKLRSAFRVVAAHFRVLAHNTQVLSQSTQTLAYILAAQDTETQETQRSHESQETQENGTHASQETQVHVHARAHVGVFDAHQWDAVRAKVDEANGRVVKLLEKQEDMEDKFCISKDGEQ